MLTGERKGSTISLSFLVSKNVQFIATVNFLYKSVLNAFLKLTSWGPSSDAYATATYDTVIPLVQIMACRLFGTKPVSEPIARILSIGPLRTNFSEILFEIQTFSLRKYI